MHRSVRVLLVLLILACVLGVAPAAHAEFPFAANPNRCDVSGANPPGCIALPFTSKFSDRSDPPMISSTPTCVV